MSKRREKAAGVCNRIRAFKKKGSTDRDKKKKEKGMGEMNGVEPKGKC